MLFWAHGLLMSRCISTESSLVMISLLLCCLLLWQFSGPHRCRRRTEQCSSAVSQAGDWQLRRVRYGHWSSKFLGECPVWWRHPVTLQIRRSTETHAWSHGLLWSQGLRASRSVMLSPRGQSGLGLDLKDLASAWPRISLSYYVIGHFWGKNRVKFGNFVNFFPAIILNRMFLIIILYFFYNYFWPRPWPQALNLRKLASTSAS